MTADRGGLWDVLWSKWTIAAGLLLLVKIYIRCTTGMCRSTRRMEGRTVIVTGANSGIGKETARDLARRGARVILACRNMDRANTARDEIVASTGNQDVVVRKLDLASLSSVREFSKQILESEPRLDVLINNAGVASIDDKKTKDNILVGMQANHFGHFLLSNLLLGLLKKSTPSRIVTVSSVMHRISNLSVDNLNGEKSFNWITLYPNSKLANMLTSIHLAKILDGTGVTSNCLHPGVIVTGIWRHVPPGLRQVLLFFLRMVLKDVVEGAQTTIHLAVSEQVEGVTGKYFAECKEVTPSAKARDEGLARKLWEKSEQIVQLTPQETVL